MENKFNELGITAPILKAIEDMGFATPTEVQSRAIPQILKNEDLIVMSKTGSGKTAVFGVSMLQMTNPEAAGPQGLVLTPARELAVQVDNDIRKLAKYLRHKTTAVYGQHNINAETQILSQGVSIVTGTPGRVFDHIQHGSLKTKNIKFLVLDEADRMLDMGFLDQVVRIIKTLPRERVTLLFSATIPPEIRRICSQYMKNPSTIEIESQTKTVDTIHQTYYRVEYNEKNTQVSRLLLVEKPESCMIFCNTKAAVDRVQTFLARKGYSSQALHGDIPQSKRLNTIQQFKQGKFHLLVATDVAARGIHIEGLSLVINYDVPNDKDNYVHRIGRTGRAGNDGRAITLVTGDDIITLYEIEEHIGALIAEAELPSEEEFNKAKADASEWIEVNTLKARPARVSTSSDTKAGQMKEGNRKPSRSNSSPSGSAGKNYGKHNAHPVNTDSNAEKSRGPKTGDRQPKPSHVAHSERQSRAANASRVTRDTGAADTMKTKRQPGETPSTRPQRVSKPIHTASRHVSPRNAGSTTDQSKQNIRDTAPNPAKPIQKSEDHKSTPKKSFLRRVLERVLNK
jgi:ATP-dependent RNA helicase DeaD